MQSLLCNKQQSSLSVDPQRRCKFVARASRVTLSSFGLAIICSTTPFAKEHRLNHLYLRAFYTVALESSFSKAAQILNVSQSTLSSHVKALEEKYDVRLLERRSRTVVTTDIGEKLLAHCRLLFEQEENIHALLNRSQRLQSGRLKVGADGPKHVLPVLRRFMRLHPDIDVSLYSGNAKKVTQELLDYETDVAIVANLQPAHPHLYVEPFSQYRLLAFVPHTHPLAQKPSIRIHELADQRVILREKTSLTRVLLNKSLESAGVTLKNTVEMDNREVIREAVAMGMGISLMSEIEFPSNDQRTVAIAIDDPHLTLTEYVTCRTNRKDARAIKEFFRLAQEVRTLT